MSIKMNINVESWACPACTFINTQHHNCCEICHTADTVYHIVNSGESFKPLDKVARVQKVFGKTSRILLPVLSCYTTEQFMKNITVLFTHSAIDGVWIESANCDADVLHDVIAEFKAAYPGRWIGINLIGETFMAVVEFLKKSTPDGIWMDRSYLTDADYQTLPNLVLDFFNRSGWQGLYFGGVLFKYVNTQFADDAKLCQNAREYMDVLTTSGAGTGIAIDKDKLVKIKSSVGDKQVVAVASGITADNIDMIKDYCDIYMLRTAIVDKNDDIDISALNTFVNKYTAL